MRNGSAFGVTKSMTLTEPTDSTLRRLIPIADFETCLIDGKTRKEIIALYPSRQQGAYYLSKLKRYLRDIHSMDLKDYCVQYGGITWPKCPGTGKEVGYNTESGAGLIVNGYARGGMRKENHPAFKAFCDRIAVERQGEGNPMHGHEPWNSGLTAETDPTMARIAEQMKGRVMTPEQVQANRERMLARLQEHGPLHTMPHSPETVEKMRVITARRWAEGGFNRGATSIQIKMREFLNSLSLTESFEEEHQVVYYSLDFAFKDAKIGIECDGDYFHINPQFYPNGPKDAIQRRNAGRDRAKNTFVTKQGWTLLRFWECDINAGTFKEPLLCKLRESGLLSQ